MKHLYTPEGLPGGSGVKNLPANSGDSRDASSISGSGRSPEVGNGSPFQYSCLENSTEEPGRLLPGVLGAAESQKTD